MNVEQNDLTPFTNNSSRYIIKFDTEKEAIDADTLANALSAYKSAVLSLADDRHEGEALFVDVDVVNKGCVEIHTILTAVQSIINPETLPAIVDGIKNLVALYKFLKGKPAKKVAAADPHSENAMSQVVITNAENSTITVHANVYKTYINYDTPPFGDSRNYNQDKISSVRMLDADKNEHVRIDQSEFGSFEKRRHRVDDDDIQDMEEVLDLVVMTVPLGAPRNQWKFIHKGEQIKAKITDQNFIAKVDRRGVTFGKGDWMQAKVLTRRELDPTLNCVVVKSRTILHVIKYSAGSAAQMSLGFMSD